MIQDFILIYKEGMPLKYHSHFDERLKIDFTTFQTSAIPETWKSQPTEYTLNQICNKINRINKDNNLRGILIDLGIGGKSRETNFAINLAIHIRLDEIQLPLIIINETDLTVKNRIIIPPSSYEILINFGVAKFLTYNQVFDKTQSIDGKYPLYENLPDSFNLNDFLQKYAARQPDGRHQVTNEWGAVKLALNAGYTQDDIDYDFPQTLYFKYLRKKYPLNHLNRAERQQLLTELKSDLDPEKIDLSTFLTDKKILLIDDNSDKGWQLVLQKFFRIVDIKTDYERVNQFGNLIDFKPYGLVFLDLRLPKILNKDVKPDYGFKLLESIKKQYPEIPVIVFTASNKSWTLNEVIEMGADGMYVKEAPEYADDSQYSKENFKNFLKTVLSCFEKYKVLRPYWEQIEKIKNNFLPEIEDSESVKTRSRIEERLDMFYGLLKRGFEQRKYNQERFYFSDFELAFITLWSILNEISEAMYEKIAVITRLPSITLNDRNGHLISTHPNPTHDDLIPFPPSDKEWKIRNQTEYLFMYLYNFKDFDSSGLPIKDHCSHYLVTKTVKSNLKFDNNTPPYYKHELNEFIPIKTLHCQIAYLILTKNQLKSSSSLNDFLVSLKRLNEIRNNLYLTHGDNITTGFYSKTEKQKRTDGDHNIRPEGDIKKLFELIAYLLTGIERTLIF